MAKDIFPIDSPDDEIPPANPARRRVAMYTGCLFVLVILVFLIWFGATYTSPDEDRRPSIIGMVVADE